MFDPELVLNLTLLESPLKVGKLHQTKSLKLVFIDGETKEVLSDVDSTYKLGDKEVKIITQPDFMSRAILRVVPTENSNGVGILCFVRFFDKKSRDILTEPSV